MHPTGVSNQFIKLLHSFRMRLSNGCVYERVRSFDLFFWLFYYFFLLSPRLCYSREFVLSRFVDESLIQIIILFLIHQNQRFNKF